MSKPHPEFNARKLSEDFHADGYLRINPLYSHDETGRINAELDRFLRDGVPHMPANQVYYEDKNDSTSIKQLQKLFDHDAYFHDMMFNGPIRRLAEIALGGDVEPINMQYFNKPPGIGLATPPHQDGYFFHLDPPLAVTGWLALEDVDHENGCIHYVRGSHQVDGYRPHTSTGVLGFSQGMKDFGTDADNANTVAMLGCRGTFLMHHAKTIHWAGANTSLVRSRRALGFIYYAKSATVDLAAKARYQANLDARLKKDGKIGS